MLSNVLGIFVAFISIILLLSVVVTALVQASQAVFRLRGRNLMKSLAAIIAETKSDKKDEPPTSHDKGTSKKLASKILNAPNVALINRVSNPDSPLSYWMMGPAVSWVDAKELPKAIESEAKEIKDLTESITTRFEKSEAHIKKRFSRTVRVWTLGWAVLVAILFQVSTPELLEELARDADRREMIVANVDKTIVTAGEAISRLDYESAAVEALQVLQRKYPDLREVIEGANGVGTNRDSLVGELRLVLEDATPKLTASSGDSGTATTPILSAADRPSNEDILAEYNDLLDLLAQEQLDTALLTAGDMINQLDTFGVRLWFRGWDYYFDESRVKFDALIGVLITAVLLSFGAPFWYEQLRNVVNLRDILSPRSVPPPQDSSTDSGNTGSSSGPSADTRG